MSTLTLSQQAFHRATAPMFAILTSEQMQRLVELSADELLVARLEYLSDRANEGELTEAERAEYEAYVEANNLLAVIQSEARYRLTHDRPLFADLVDVTFNLGQKFYELLRETDDFIPLHDPQCNIVVFRHIPERLRTASPEDLGRFQLALRRKVIESGEFYLVPTQFEGTGALRVTLINPLTTETDLRDLLDCLRRVGRNL